MALPLLKQVAEAINHIHSKGFFHRDVKMTNIIINRRGQAKLFDFGFAGRVGHKVERGRDGMVRKVPKKQFSFCGTPSYMSPEIMMKQQYYGQLADVWAFGVVVFKTLTSQYPFGNERTPDLKHNIVTRNFKFAASYMEYLKPELSRVIFKILKVDPEKRMGFPEILGLMNELL